MENKIIIAGFPGIGKTHFYNNQLKTKKYKVKDSDSSQYSKVISWEKKYFDDVIKSLKTHDICLISTHKEVRNIFIENGITINLIYPPANAKSFYLDLYKSRGNDPKFIDFMDDKFEKFINEINIIESCHINRIKTLSSLTSVVEAHVRREAILNDYTFDYANHHILNRILVGIHNNNPKNRGITWL